MLRTVYTVLEEAEALDALKDPLIEAATREIISPPGAPRYDVQREIKQKERAIEHIAGRYQNAKISADAIKLCLYSIGMRPSMHNRTNVAKATTTTISPATATRSTR